jgi:poly(3-hydroxybutyrate) depolymerase
MYDYSISKNLYNIVEAWRSSLAPFRSLVATNHSILANRYNPFVHTEVGKSMLAGLEMLERITRNYKKPEFGITTAMVGGKECEIHQKTFMSKPFCNLLHFEKVRKIKQPKLLIVAPMAGHHATLLRGTVEALLPDLDIYITDWIDASQVPLEMGKFDMDDYIQYLMGFLSGIGEGSHIMAVCQPTVPTLASVAIMSEDNNKYIPNSMVLIGGPVDARKNPTDVNHFAKDKPIEWFEANVISQVPDNYPGKKRLVYPGFLQLAGFMSMNMMKHIESHTKMYQQLTSEDIHAAMAQKKFYDEYLAVMDLPAEFYLETIEEVFLDFSLATGKLMFRERKIDLSEITKTALLGIEGEKDDIAGVGQTKASLKLCKNIPDDMKQYHLQEGVGHYGVFSGSKFTQYVAPVIVDFIKKFNK